MSLLRPSIAGRLLRAGAPAARQVIPATARYDSHTALATPLKPSESAIGEAEKAEGIRPRQNQPDYAAEVDQASSCVSPEAIAFMLTGLEHSLQSQNEL